MIGIYVIKNTVNDKVYIGQSWNISERIAEHKRLLRTNKSTNVHLQGAYNLYGESAFEFAVLEDLSILETQEKLEAQRILDKRESYWIQYFGGCTSNSTYNIRDGGSFGKFSDEYKHQLSLQRRDKYSGENNPMFGKHHTEQTKQLISQNRKNKRGRTGPLSDETKKKLSLAQKNRVLSDEERARRSENMKELRKSESFVLKAKEAAKQSIYKNIKYDDSFVLQLRKEHSEGMSIKKLSIKYDIPFESCRIMIKGERRFSQI